MSFFADIDLAGVLIATLAVVGVYIWWWQAQQSNAPHLGEVEGEEDDTPQPP